MNNDCSAVSRRWWQWKGEAHAREVGKHRGISLIEIMALLLCLSDGTAGDALGEIDREAGARLKSIYYIAFSRVSICRDETRRE